MPLILALLSLVQNVHSGEQTMIVAAGATTVQPIVQQAAKVFETTHPNVKFIVGAGGSDHGVNNTGAGKIQLGLVGRALKDTEKEQYKDLVAVTVGLDGIGIVVNASNPLEKITKEQVQDIYAGKIINWKQLGGPDAPIVLGSRTKGHAQLDLFLSYFGMEAQFGEGDEGVAYRKKGTEAYSVIKARRAVNNDKMLEVVLNPAGIGYLPIGFAQTKAEKGTKVKLLQLDGIAATTSTVADSTYPLRRPLLVVTKGPPEGVLKEFIDYLVGEEGQKIVASHDYIPIKKEQK